MVSCFWPMELESKGNKEKTVTGTTCYFRFNTMPRQLLGKIPISIRYQYTFYIKMINLIN